MHAEEPGQNYASYPSPSPHPQKAGPGCYFPSPQPLDQTAGANLHLSQHHSPTPRVPTLSPFPLPGSTLDNATCQQRSSPRLRRCCEVLPCLLSPSSHLRAVLGARRNPSRPSSRENDLQGWGPQASMQAGPINIKQRGCPGVLPRHVLSLGQALTSAQCQMTVQRCRACPAGTGSLCCRACCTALREQQGG